MVKTKAISSAMSDWIDDLFDDEKQNSVPLDMQQARSFAARLVRNSVDTRENKDRLISWLEDWDIHITRDEIQDFIVAVRVNQMSPRENANMSATDINEWVKTAMALDRHKKPTS